MGQKREMKAQLQSATKLRLQGLDQFKWQRRKVWQQFRTKWSECLAKMEPWRTSLKTIEGNFGTGVVAYFLFLRWLILLNLSIFTLILIFIILPQILLPDPEPKGCDRQNDSNSTECCHENYRHRNAYTSNSSFWDFFQGTAYLEKTYLFYGNYTNKTFTYDTASDLNVNQTDVDRSDFSYDLPLAYVTVSIACLLLSLIAIVRSVALEFRDRMVENEGQFYRYCNLIFGGWDFCIHNEKSAYIKHKALYNEIKGLLQARRLEFERCNRTKEVMCKLIMIRVFVNIIVCVILLLAATLIKELFTRSLADFDSNFKPELAVCAGSNNATEWSGQNADNTIQHLFYEFLPYIAIVCMNVLVPLIFNYLVQFEQYSPMFVVKINLLRTVFLRLSSLAVLLTRFLYVIEHRLITNCDCSILQGETSRLLCWETYVGQQFYKLLVLDFISHIFVTFCVNFPRAFIARHINTKFARFIGEQEFELSKHVLDIIYSQTICWLGMFYSPFLPAIAMILHFFMFYIKKFSCLINSKPSTILYRASRSNSLFMVVLLISFVLAAIPIIYAITEITPSRSCGPFRGLRSAWEAVIITYGTLPDIFQKAIRFFGTAGFAVPCFIFLVLLLYYYHAVSAANKHMVEVLKNQLVLEGHDKQFLLNRLSAFLKQQQEIHKRMKQVEQQQQQNHPPPLLPRSTAIGGSGCSNVDIVNSSGSAHNRDHSRDFKDKDHRERISRNDVRETE